MTTADFTDVSIGDTLKWIDPTPNNEVPVQIASRELVPTGLGLCAQAVYTQAGKSYGTLIPIGQLKK